MANKKPVSLIEDYAFSLRYHGLLVAATLALPLIFVVFHFVRTIADIEHAQGAMRREVIHEQQFESLQCE